MKTFHLQKIQHMINIKPNKLIFYSDTFRGYILQPVNFVPKFKLYIQALLVTLAVLGDDFETWNCVQLVMCFMCRWLSVDLVNWFARDT